MSLPINCCLFLQNKVNVVSISISGSGLGSGTYFVGRPSTVDEMWTKLKYIFTGYISPARKTKTTQEFYRYNKTWAPKLKVFYRRSFYSTNFGEPGPNRVFSPAQCSAFP